MDWEDTAWLPVLEKKGIHQTAWILENYGIDCETDVSLLDRDDFSKLTSNGLKPMEGKKLECRCNSVRVRVENMLTSSLNTPEGALLLSSEALNVLHDGGMCVWRIVCQTTTVRSHHCCSCYGLLERDNRSQERGSTGANEGSVYFQPATYLGQQDLGV